jgi:phosphoribosylglycinamide formyltransferase-1
MNIAVFASGNGTNFAAIAKAVKRGYIRAKIKLLLTDKENSFVRVRAAKYGIKDLFFDPRKFQSRLDFDKALIKILKKEKIDLVVLAGFMRILSPYFVEKYRNRIFNIHPAILPAFKGENAIERAYKRGNKLTGVTVHFVDEQVDHGPIILQERLRIGKKTLKQLEAQIHRIEHRLYPLAIKLFIEGKLNIEDRHVKII